ncbi:MAG: hypothetical protein MJZ25_10655, partial [Fibrobacter sp.]|nr:hypothetical protein [Fibrobacter sp.]
CYDNDPANCKKYGRLYTWVAAMNACPAGWHLPSKKELEILQSTVGTSKAERSLNLRARSWEYGSDEFGFSALPAGRYKSHIEEFSSLRYHTHFWSSTKGGSSAAYYLNISDGYASVDNNFKNYGYSVRCLQDSNEGDEVSSQRSKAQPSSGTLKDSRDGKTYKTVKIGDQVWMAENLNYKTSESYCYDNKEGNCKKYGRLYTWDDAKKACPAGWSLPSEEDLEILQFAVDTSEAERSPNLRARSWDNGLDKFGFSALPAGNYYSIHKEFSDLGDHTYFWSSTERNSFDAYSLSIYDGGAGVNYRAKYYGYSVRCLQDSSKAQPPSGTLKDSRDGKTYKTVKMPDGKTWMAENLNYGTKDSWCYDNDPANCKKYGRLYTWEAAKKACPAGWRLPSRDEFGRLLDIAEGIRLRARSWEDGLDMFGFSALPAGYSHNSEKFYDLGGSTRFWTSTEYDSYHAYSLNLTAYRADVDDYAYDLSDEYSVRCLQDN